MSRIVFLIIGIFACLLAAGGLAAFLLSLRRTLFRYRTIYFLGLFLFFLVQAVPMLLICARILSGSMPAADLGEYVAGMGFNFMIFTSPLVLFFAVSMTISNLSLIRHEGRRLRNLLGAAIGGLMILGLAVTILIDMNFSGNDAQYRIYITVSVVYTTVIAYFECMLLAIILCGVISAVKMPAQDLDYVIILGCRISKDGRPLPLLRSRCDGAIAYYRKRKEAGGNCPKLVASGGKGTDEVKSEAEAIAGYLAEQGIPKEDILVENRSVNTRENMKFSMKLILADAGEKMPKVGYSTTGYHVLRSGILAETEGFSMTGIGCRTKWYYWPNAFMREFVGLMVMSFRQQAVVLVFVIAALMLLAHLAV